MAQSAAQSKEEILNCITKTDARIAQNLKHYRQKHGLTQHHVAKLLCCTLQQVQKYENNINRISTARLIIFARALGLQPHIFYDATCTPPLKKPQTLQDSIKNLSPTKQHILLTLSQELHYL